jgi:hypothetical protein
MQRQRRLRTRGDMRGCSAIVHCKQSTMQRVNGLTVRIVYSETKQNLKDVRELNIIASMAISDALHRSAFFQTATVLCVLAVLVAHVGGIRSYSNSSWYVCPTFSCGELRDVSYPFRRPEDPDGCGFPSYELSCSDTKATIRINTGTYYVVDINYTGSSFVVVDASLDTQRNCALPRRDRLPYVYGGLVVQFPPYYSLALSLAPGVAWASFVNLRTQG